MAEFSIRAGDRNPVLVATIRNEDGTPVDLTNASAAVLRMRRRDAETLAISAGMMTFVTPRTSGKVQYAWGATDTGVDDIGSYWADVRITWNDGTTQSFPTPDLLSIDIVPDLANLPVISDADLTVLRAALGPEPADTELAILLERLGSVDAVVAQVIDGRLAAMLAQPAKASLEGDLSWDNTAGIKALSEASSRLRNAVHGPRVGRLYRTDRER